MNKPTSVASVKGRLIFGRLYDDSDLFFQQPAECTLEFFPGRRLTLGLNPSLASKTTVYSNCVGQHRDLAEWHAPLC